MERLVARRESPEIEQFIAMLRRPFDHQTNARGGRWSPKYILMIMPKKRLISGMLR